MKKYYRPFIQTLFYSAIDSVLASQPTEYGEEVKDENFWERIG